TPRYTIMDTFNPDAYLASKAGGFDPDAYLASKQYSDALAQRPSTFDPRTVGNDALGDSVPVEQKLLNNTISALTGATLPSAAAGLVKGIASGASDVADTAAQYAGRFGESQMGKLHGTSALQFKQLGQ